MPAEPAAVEIEQAFYSDLVLPDMLFARLIRARNAPGILEVVSAPELPEGYTMYTAEDIPGKNSVTLGDVQTGIFASSRVSYAGEPVGILTGPDLSRIDRLLSLVDVRVLPDPVRPEAPRPLAERMVCAGGTDAELVYRKAESRVDGEYTIMLKPPLCMEYTGCLASCDSRGLLLYSSSPRINHLRKTVAAVLGIAENRVTVRKTIATEGNSNSMLHTAAAAQAALASFLRGVPVKLEYTRSEHEFYVQNTLPVIISHKTALNANGMLDAMLVQISASGGDYCPFAQEILDRLVIAATGIYRPKTLKITGRIYKTPGPPAGVYFPRIDYQSFFAVESQMQKIAQTLNVPSLELRQKNSAETALFRNSFPFAFHLGNQEEVFQTLAALSDYNRKSTAYSLNAQAGQLDIRRSAVEPVRGIGLAAAFEGSVFLGSEAGFADQSIEVVMEKDGSASISSYQTSPAVNQIWARIASEELQVPPEKIRILENFECGKEPRIPEHDFDNIGVMIQLLRKCCAVLQKQRFRAPLPIRVTRTLTSTQRKVWNQKEFSGAPFFSTATAAAVVELDLDPYTCRDTIRRIWVVIDCGEILAPEAAEKTVKTTARQVLSSLAQGDLFTNTEVIVRFVQTAGESRQIGSLMYRVLPAAYANALSQALGSVMPALPLGGDTLFNEMTKHKTAAVEEGQE
jgi:CO/xanthine dehydrogenase Mo-binding subunit